MIDDRYLDQVLEQSAPDVDPDEARASARSVFVAHRGARPSVVRGRRAMTLVLVAGGAVGIGATAAAVDGASLATHLGWTADNAVDHTSRDGNECHLAYRAIPETGLVKGPKAGADDPSVLAAQAFLRTLDLDTLSASPADVAALRSEYENGTHVGPGEAPDYTDAFFENQVIFMAMVDEVKAELARQGLPSDGVVTFEGANECTDEILQR